MTNIALLRQKISDSGLKTQYIADKLGLHRVSLSMKINGHRQFNQYEISKLCDVLNITDPAEMQLIFLTDE